MPLSQHRLMTGGTLPGRIPQSGYRRRKIADLRCHSAPYPRSAVVRRIRPYTSDTQRNVHAARASRNNRCTGATARSARLRTD
jgi:hypothetical protein